MYLLLYMISLGKKINNNISTLGNKNLVPIFVLGTKHIKNLRQTHHQNKDDEIKQKYSPLEKR